MIEQLSSRRRFVVAIATGILGTTVASAASKSAKKSAEADEDAVTANEDLMREHGVIRRALLVYAESERRLRADAGSLPVPSLGSTTVLLRRFAEDYHERLLEEAHIFPVVRKVRGPVASLPDILQTQHQRGRGITDYVASVVKTGNIPSGSITALADALAQFVRMYDPHAAREDTEVFPAWKNALGAKAYAEMGERFEAIEKKTFGHDGFDDALAQIQQIEKAFGMSDLSKVTPPERAPA